MLCEGFLSFSFYPSHFTPSYPHRPVFDRWIWPRTLFYHLLPPLGYPGVFFSLIVFNIATVAFAHIYPPLSASLIPRASRPYTIPFTLHLSNHFTMSRVSIFLLSIYISVLPVHCLATAILPVYHFLFPFSSHPPIFDRYSLWTHASRLFTLSCTIYHPRLAGFRSYPL